MRKLTADRRGGPKSRSNFRPCHLRGLQLRPQGFKAKLFHLCVKLPHYPKWEYALESDVEFKVYFLDFSISLPSCVRTAYLLKCILFFKSLDQDLSVSLNAATVFRKWVFSKAHTGLAGGSTDYSWLLLLLEQGFFGGFFLRSYHTSGASKVGEQEMPHSSTQPLE